ncbi:hypothetical protein DPMN_038678 [Dreissena polymorpha]|uniref:Uncharacterized protein n=1 Tax=Dreissena polymorpha TaxID=45954 RepID=A0A9D4RQI8_DREPO|nr:hypothetical protein DPMN_038678 [Dreissena polymorpha]
MTRASRVTDNASQSARTDIMDCNASTHVSIQGAWNALVIMARVSRARRGCMATPVVAPVPRVVPLTSPG